MCIGLSRKVTDHRDLGESIRVSLELCQPFRSTGSGPARQTRCLQPHSLFLAFVFQLAGLTASLFTPGSEDVRSELIPRYLAAVEARKSAGQCVTAEVTVRAKLSDREAELRAVRSTPATGGVTHHVLDARGYGTVRREVIGRYPEAEGQATQLDEIAITPFRYRFPFLRTVLEAGRRVHIFQLSPRQRRAGLFNGELGLDSQTAPPVRGSGQFVKTPSVFVKRIKLNVEFDHVTLFAEAGCQ